jgi:PAS domain S-box-containing protein
MTNEQRLKVLIASMSDMVLIGDMKGNLLLDSEINNWENITGQSLKEAATNKGWHKMIHPECILDIKNNWKGLIVDGKNLEIQCKVKHKYGAWQWMEFRATPIKDEKDEIKEWIGAFTDINERKLKEEKLKINEILLRHTGEVTKVAGWERNLITDEYFLSDQMYLIRDLEIGDNLTMNNSVNFYKAEHALYLKKAFDDLVFLGKEYDHELPMVTAKGREIWVRSVGKAEFKDGKVVKTYGTMQDITEKKNAELKLFQTNTFLQTLLDSTHYAIISVNREGIIALFNNGAEKMLGYTAEEMIGLKTPETFHDSGEINAYSKEVSQELGRKVSGIEALFVKPIAGIEFEREWTYIRKDCSLFPVMLCITPIHDQLGEISGFVGIARDFSERKKYETDLRQQKALTECLIQNLPYDFWARGLDNRVILQNNKAFEAWHLQQGKTPDEAEIPPEIIARWKSNNEKALAGQTVNAEVIYNVNGEERYFNEIIAPVWDNNKIIGILGTNIDITERKEREEKLKLALDEEQNLNEVLSQREEELATREEELRASFEDISMINLKLAENEKILRMAQQVAKIGSWEYNIASGAISWSDQTYEIYELPLGERIDFDKFINIHTPEAAKLLKGKMGYSIACNEPYHIEYRYYPASGGYKDILGLGYPVSDNDGNVVSFYGSIQDITERKVIEESLRKSQQLTKETGRTAKVGGYEFDIATKKIRWTDETYAIHEMSPGLLLNGSDEFYIPEHKPIIWELAEKAITDGEESDCELQILTAKGNLKWVKVIIKVEKINNKPHRLYGAIQDITDSKVAEEKLRTNEEFLNSIIENMPIGIVVFDVNGGVKRMNNTHKQYSGLTEDFSPGEYFSAFKDRLLSETRFNEFFERTLNGEIITNEVIEVDFGSPNNTWSARSDLVWFSVNVFAISEFDKVKSVIAITRDITLDKANEKKIEEHTQQLIQTNKKMAEYKLIALRSVMNPHFLFNSLNSIQSFIATNEKEQALNYLSLFSKLIRSILNSSIENNNTLAEEIEILKLYINLETLRFDNQFKTVIEIDNKLDLDNIEIPSLILQPYVENAILHGLYNNTKVGLLKIKFTLKDEKLMCIIEDNGIGRAEAKKIKQANKLHRSVGMLVTEERLELINKDNSLSVQITDLFSKDNKPAGTRIEIGINI